MIFVTVRGVQAQLPFEDGITQENLKQKTFTVWEKFLDSFSQRLVPQPVGNFVLAASVVRNHPARVCVTSVPPVMGPDVDVQITFTLDLNFDDLMVLYHNKIVNLATTKKALNDALLKAEVHCPSCYGILQKLDLIVPTKLEQLIEETEAKLKDTNRTTTLENMLADLKELQEVEEPESQILAKAADILGRYGSAAQQDHENHSGWRFGGFVMGLFGMRDKAPLMHSSSTFKNATNEIITKFVPKQ